MNLRQWTHIFLAIRDHVGGTYDNSPDATRRAIVEAAIRCYK